MGGDFAGQLDLEHAWDVAKWDISNRNFVDYPYQVEVVEASRASWLEQIRSELRVGFNASTCEIVDVPKAGFLSRPGARLRLRDAVVYSALGQAVRDATADWLHGMANVDHSYVLRRRGMSVPWFRDRFQGWRAFHDASIRRIDRGASYVVFSDLVGYYENIDLGRLRDMLLAANVSDDVLGLLMPCLRKWSGARMRGIPQGVSASDLLAKLYLDPMDRRLRREGYEHLRYVDDIRIFCGSHREARRALRVLTALLRERGLNVQSAKTRILDATSARAYIEKAVPAIKKMEKTFAKEARDQVGWTSPYIFPQDLKDLREELAAGTTRDAVEAAFAEICKDADDLDPSIFHYLLNRLGALGSPVAQDYALQQLRDRPEETEHVLRYLLAIGVTEAAAKDLVAYLVSEDAIYEYQRFQILRWLYGQDPLPCCEEVLSFARGLVKDRAQPLWLRSYAIAIVGRCGDDADLESLEECYESSTGELEGAIIVCALSRMHKARRNSFYGRAAGDGFLVAAATRWGKESSNTAGTS